MNRCYYASIFFLWLSLGRLCLHHVQFLQYIIHPKREITWKTLSWFNRLEEKLFNRLLSGAESWEKLQFSICFWARIMLILKYKMLNYFKISRVLQLFCTLIFCDVGSFHGYWTRRQMLALHIYREQFIKAREMWFLVGVMRIIWT